MKQLIMVLSAILVCTCSFAGTQSEGLAKNSPQLKALGSSWERAQAISPKQNTGDITIVYGGEDISLRPSLIPSTTTV